MYRYQPLVITTTEMNGSEVRAKPSVQRVHGHIETDGYFMPWLSPSLEGDCHQPNPCLHTFYYAWYGNIETDGQYMHWNHRYLPHWKESITRNYPQGRHIPPDDTGASYYPELGCYSSKDPDVIHDTAPVGRCGGDVVSGTQQRKWRSH